MSYNLQQVSYGYDNNVLQLTATVSYSYNKSILTLEQQCLTA